MPQEINNGNDVERRQGRKEGAERSEEGWKDETIISK